MLSELMFESVHADFFHFPHSSWMINYEDLHCDLKGVKRMIYGLPKAIRQTSTLPLLVSMVS
jgi:hypothetical protein